MVYNWSKFSIGRFCERLVTVVSALVGSGLIDARTTHSATLWWEIGVISLGVVNIFVSEAGEKVAHERSRPAGEAIQQERTQDSRIDDHGQSAHRLFALKIDFRWLLQPTDE